MDRRSSFLILIYSVIFLLLLCILTNGQGVGRITLTEPPSQSLNAPDVGLPVSLEAFSSSSQVVIEGLVDVNCSLSISVSESGYTQATFSSVLYNSTATSTGLLTVPLRLTQSGRPNQIICEANTLGNRTEYQFVNTLSNTVNIHGVAPAKILFASDSITVPNVDSLWSASVQLTLSATADSTVTIGCNVTSFPGSTELRFTPATVLTGASEVTMIYSIIKKAAGVSPVVVCFAQSLSGSQYSSDSSSTLNTTFILDRGTAELSPPSGTVAGLSFQVTLSLDQSVRNVVEFECHIASFISAFEASSYPTEECQVPPALTRPSTTTAVPTTAPAFTTDGSLNGTTGADSNFTTPQDSTSNTTSTTTPIATLAMSGTTTTLSSMITTDSASTDTSSSNASNSATTTEMSNCDSVNVTNLCEVNNSSATANISSTTEFNSSISASTTTPVTSTVTGSTTQNSTITDTKTVTHPSTSSPTKTITNTSSLAPSSSSTTSLSADSTTTTTSTTSTTTSAPTTTTTATSTTTSTNGMSTIPYTTSTSATADATTSTTAKLTTTDSSFGHLDTSTWELPAYVNSTVSLRVNEQRLSFEVARISPPQFSTKEFLVIACCTVEEKSEERYGGAQAISRIEFDYTYPDPLNISAVQYGPTTLLDPAYVNLAPCPCDLFKDSCDFDCFCDNDCTEEEKSLFGQNITGFFGGEAPLPADNACSQNNRIGSPDWAPFLCTQFENNAHLGDFYSLQLPITESDLLPSLSTTSYRIGEYPLSTPFGLTVGYNKGAWIDRSTIGYIGLPQPTYNGMCTDTVPIRYLNDADSSCTMTMEERLCTDSMSRLNAANYLQRTDGVFNSAPFQTVIQVARKHGLSDVTVPIETNFLCTDNYDASSEATHYCSWDDDQTYPPLPTMDSHTCRNAVVSVTYMIEYNNTAIEKITASYIFADIPLEVTDTSSYTRSWYESVPSNNTASSANHTASSNATSAANKTFVSVLKAQSVTYSHPSRSVQFAARYRVKFIPFGLTEDVVRHSGRPGYNIGSAINIVSVDQSNITTLLPEPALAFPIAGADGLCRDSASNLLAFASNQMSQCQLVVPAQSFTDCDTLRVDVLEQLESLVPILNESFYVSRFGTPNYRDWSQWLPIFRDIAAYNSSEENTTTTAAPNDATDMPLSGIETVTMEPQVSLLGKCSSVPASVHLIVMYALSGRSAGFPIYLIYGVKVQVTSMDWHLPCQHGECEEGRFPLSFTSEYVEIPSTRPPSISRYQKRKMDECVSCEPPWTLEAFLYPVAGARIPEELRAENLAMFLLLVSCITVFWYMTRPWLHKHYLLV